MKKEILFPDEPILLIEFYHSDKFKRCSFNNIEYEIIGEDDVGNLVGIKSNKEVYYLDTDLKIAVYMANDAEILIQELKLYKNYCIECNLSENPSDDELKDYVYNFRHQLEKIDSSAFNNENNFWSVILEQMETEQL